MSDVHQAIVDAIRSDVGCRPDRILEFAPGRSAMPAELLQEIRC